MSTIIIVIEVVGLAGQAVAIDVLRKRTECAWNMHCMYINMD